MKREAQIKKLPRMEKVLLCKGFMEGKRRSIH